MNENAMSTVIYLALFMMIISVFVTVWLRRQRSHSIDGEGLRLIQRLSLGQREQVVLIEMAGERMLLGVTSSEIQLLCTVRQSTELNKIGTKVLVDHVQAELSDNLSERIVINS